jgi:hypothetical protein
VNYRGTIKSKSDREVADADADLMIAKVSCATRIAPENYACLNRAKAVNARLVADASDRYAK